jgi:hypothetical protein
LPSPPPALTIASGIKPTPAAASTPIATSNTTATTNSSHHGNPTPADKRVEKKNARREHSLFLFGGSGLEREEATAKKETGALKAPGTNPEDVFDQLFADPADARDAAGGGPGDANLGGVRPGKGEREGFVAFAQTAAAAQHASASIEKFIARRPSGSVGEAFSQTSESAGSAGSASSPASDFSGLFAPELLSLSHVSDDTDAHFPSSRAQPPLTPTPSADPHASAAAATRALDVQKGGLTAALRDDHFALKANTAPILAPALSAVWRCVADKS